jgi:hypothetical protein
VLALTISSGELATSLPFAGTLAWTALLLAAASRYLRAPRWPGRLLWGSLGAGAWGQLAAAHFSVGLAMGTGALVTYAAVVGWQWWARERWNGIRAVGARILLLAALAAALNLAYFLPRLAYLPRTDLSLGYGRLVELGGRLSGAPAPVVVGASSGVEWVLKLATFPGVYVGAIALLLCFAGGWSRRWRPLVVGFGAYGVLGYLLSLSIVARHIPGSWRNWRPVDLYLHSPEWFGYILLPVLAVLAAAGVDAWVEPRPRQQRIRMIAPGALLWVVLPTAAGAGLSHVAWVMLGFVVGGMVLAGVASRSRLAVALPAILAVELATLGVAGNHDSTIPFKPFPVLLQAVANPQLRGGSFLRPGPMVAAIRADGPARYMKLPRPGKTEPLPPITVHGMLANHSLLFETEDTGTFNPVQPFRYWVFVRASQREDVKYNRSYFVDPPPIALNLLQVGWIVAPVARPAPADARPVVAEGSEAWELYRRDTTPRRAEAISDWRVVPGADGAAFPNPALNAILAPSFDPDREVILEVDPGLASPAGGPSGVASRTSFVSLGDQAAVVTVDTDTPAVVLVRATYDPNWHAEVDGLPSVVLRADYFLQAVAVPAGHHVIALRYHDPRIGYGLWGSGVAVLAVAIAGLATRRRSGATFSPP